MDLRNVKALLFDKDGTLFDFAATWEPWAEAFLLRVCEGDRGLAARVGAAMQTPEPWRPVALVQPRWARRARWDPPQLHRPRPPPPPGRTWAR